MTQYSVKIVNHTSFGDDDQKKVQKELEALFTEAFKDTKDTVVVCWGEGLKGDNIIIRFVQDVAHSYVAEKMPGKALGKNIGGHTRTRNKVTCSEMYRDVPGHDKISANNRARLAFHESMHNVAPDLTEDEIAATGGLGGSPARTPMTDKNKELMQTGIAKSNPQLL